MSYSDAEIWAIIIVMGIGTYLIRLSFLGLVGDRRLPDWLLRHLRYAPVAVMPGLVAPLVLWPAATDGALDAPRLLAAAATVAAGLVTGSVLASVIGGAGTLYLMLWLIG